MTKKIFFSVILFMFISMVSCDARSSNEEFFSDIRNFDGIVGIYAKNIKTGKTLKYNYNSIFPTASTSKLVVALATYKYLYPLAAEDETRLCYDENIKNMMIVSDNAAFNELLAEIEVKKPDALLKVTKDLRLAKTQIHSEAAFSKYQYHSVTTPYEMAKVFESIYKEKYLGKEKSGVLKNELANTIFHEEIPRYMLTKVMHKVGELDNVLCDVGIVDDGKNQILISAYTVTEKPVDYASDFIADISSKLYNQLRKK